MTIDSLHRALRDTSLNAELLAIDYFMYVRCGGKLRKSLSVLELHFIIKLFVTIPKNYTELENECCDTPGSWS